MDKKLALLSVVAVMLAACGKKEKIPHHMRFGRTDLDGCASRKAELDPHNTMTAIYHFDGEEALMLAIRVSLDLGGFKGGKNEKQILELTKTI